MSSFTDYLIPALILLVMLAASFKRVSVYDVFTKGASKAVEISLGVFPYIAAILIMVQLLRASGATAFAANILAPVFGFLGIPKELSELVLIRPFTSSGSLAILDTIYQTHGADSYISRCATAVMSSSETVFYVTAVYFSQSKVRRLAYCIPVALTASLLSTITACLLCRIM